MSSTKAQENTTPKTVGYGGFQSYGVTQCPTEKLGKFDKGDEIWQSTIRSPDNLAFYDNYNRTTPSYAIDYDRTIKPEDFKQIKHVKLGQGPKQLRVFENPGLQKHKLTNTINFYDELLHPTKNFAESPTADEVICDQPKNLDELDKEQVRQKLGLPEDLRIERKVDNPLYDIYYIPDYDKFAIGGCPDFKTSDNGITKKGKLRQNSLLSSTGNSATLPNLNNLPNINNQKNVASAIVTMIQESQTPNINVTKKANWNTMKRGHHSTDNLTNQMGLSRKIRINTTGVHNAKREPQNRIGTMSVQNPLEKLKDGTEFWQTTHQNNYEDYSNLTSNISKAPEWSLHKPPYVAQYKIGASEYRFNYGELGSNPREKLPMSSRTLTKREDALKLGTSECTSHLPGYTGFIPNTLISHGNSISQAKGENTRKTIIKENINENFHRQIPGYCGHNATAAMNDRGDIRESIFYANDNHIRDI